MLDAVAITLGAVATTISSDFAARERCRIFGMIDPARIQS